MTQQNFRIGHIPAILFGGRDDLQTLTIMENFCAARNARLTVSEESAHAFMEDGDVEIVANWLREDI